MPDEPKDVGKVEPVESHQEHSPNNNQRSQRIIIGAIAFTVGNGAIGAIRFLAGDFDKPTVFYINALAIVLSILVSGFSVCEILPSLKGWIVGVCSFLILGAILLTVRLVEDWHPPQVAVHLQSAGPTPQSSPTGQPFEPLRFTSDISRWVLQVGDSNSSYEQGNCEPIMIPYPLSCGKYPVVTAYCRDNTFGVNVDLFPEANPEAKDGPHAYLQYGTYFLDVPGWDWNSDHNALEFVDENQTPRMQVIYKTPGYIEVFGAFGNGPNSVSCLADRNGTHIGNIPWPPALSRIFKYPSDTHPHIREAKSD
jgi:hypothetical protein